MKEFVIEKKDSGQRLDKFLQRLLPNASKSFLYKMMRKKNIVLNDKKVEGNELLVINDTVKLWFSDDTFNKFTGSGVIDINISEYIDAYKNLNGVSVLYENEHFLLVYKPAGILSQKANKDDLSVNEWIIGYCISSNKISVESLSSCKPSVTNRLDRNTSGIILAGKTVYGLNKLTELIRNRDIKKYYLTYVYGKLNDSDLLVGYHLKDEQANKVSILSEKQFSELSESKKCLYTVIKTQYFSKDIFSLEIDNEKYDISKLEIDLITGKSHQIRAHLAHIGHPLLGDDKYGKRELNRKLGLKYQLLHAYKIVFPIDGDLNELSGKEIICQPSNLEVFEARFLKS